MSATYHARMGREEYVSLRSGSDRPVLLRIGSAPQIQKGANQRP
jgi:hypothetical protein